MKRYLLLLALASMPLQAQQAAPGAPEQVHTEGDGHDHGDEGKPIDPRNESNLDYFWRKSDDAFHAGDYERAVACHRAIVALDPADIESYGVASWLLWSMG